MDIAVEVDWRVRNTRAAEQGDTCLPCRVFKSLLEGDGGACDFHDGADAFAFRNVLHLFDIVGIARIKGVIRAELQGQCAAFRREVGDDHRNGAAEGGDLQREDAENALARDHAAFADFQMELADTVEGEGGDVREGRVKHADVFRNLHDFFLLDVVGRASAGICVQIIGRDKPVMLDGIEGMARPVDDDFVADFVVFDVRPDGDDFA